MSIWAYIVLMAPIHFTLGLRIHSRITFCTGSIQVVMAQQVVDSGRMGVTVALGIGQMLTSGMRSISPFLVSFLFFDLLAKEPRWR